MSLVFLQEQLKHFGVFCENSHDDDGEEEDVKEWLDATEEAPRPPSLPVRAGLRPRYRCARADLLLPRTDAVSYITSRNVSSEMVKELVRYEE